ncbi:ABC transporter permease [Zavarzinia compransoris]|uniref:ABC transporter permease n=1 Tax=Zavarzinia marina TaxID=2911065 RepID=UPI001F184F0A|nr:ABC transporter permease [Zavarzinia marina]MCF4164238.1 ABC transporter permease [Zavarzinia marina]
MALKIEARRQISTRMLYLTPFIAVAATVVAGFFVFMILGSDPVESLYVFFLSPFETKYGFSELCVKAAPLIMIAIGLALGYRANIWNIGAEGQLTVGAVCGGAVALAFWDEAGIYILPLMALAGLAGGALYAAIPAFLKTRFNVNEILTSLMLTYVATLFLSVLVFGPLKDPQGYNFPQSRMFTDSATLPIIWEETRLHLGFVVALAIAVAGWVLLSRSIIGFQIRTLGSAPAAARYAGFDRTRLTWFCLMLTGALAGLAGTFEVSGPIGQLVPNISPGYGFTAIIVAFLGRLHPLGIIGSGMLMALSYMGGENAQINLGLPQAVTGVFQGMLLFFLLASDFLVRYRVRVVKPAVEGI